MSCPNPNQHQYAQHYAAQQQAYAAQQQVPRQQNQRQPQQPSPHQQQQHQRAMQAGRGDAHPAAAAAGAAGRYGPGRYPAGRIGATWVCGLGMRRTQGDLNAGCRRPGMVGLVVHGLDSLFLYIPTSFPRARTVRIRECLFIRKPFLRLLLRARGHPR